MDLSSRTIARLTAPTALAFAWVLFGAALGLAKCGEASLAFVRFAAALAFGVSALSSVRVWEACGRRGDTWDGLFVAVPLPFFDFELRTANRRSTAGVRALSLAFLCLSGFSLSVLVAAANPAERGLILLSDAAPATAWSDHGRAGLGRELPAELTLIDVDVPGGLLEVAADRVQDQWATRASIGAGESIQLGEVQGRWVGVVPEERVSAVTLLVSIDGSEERVEVPIGGSVEVLGSSIEVRDFEPSRLGSLGPAARVFIESDGSSHSAWVYLWAPDVHSAFGAGEVSVVLADLTAASAALIEISSPRPPWFLPFLAILSGLAVSMGVRFALNPVFLRGRSGDYEIVGPSRRAVERAARSLLSDSHHQEWRELLVSVRATGGGSR